MSVNRFDMHGSSHINGEYVSYSDCAKLEAENTALKEENERLKSRVEARDDAMRFALSEMVKWYENIPLGNNPAFQYYDLAKRHCYQPPTAKEPTND